MERVIDTVGIVVITDAFKDVSHLWWWSPGFLGQQTTTNKPQNLKLHLIQVWGGFLRVEKDGRTPCSWSRASTVSCAQNFLDHFEAVPDFLQYRL
jgi:hypothetical protein